MYVFGLNIDINCLGFLYDFFSKYISMWGAVGKFVVGLWDKILPEGFAKAFVFFMAKVEIWIVLVFK